MSRDNSGGGCNGGCFTGTGCGSSAFVRCRYAAANVLESYSCSATKVSISTSGAKKKLGQADMNQTHNMKDRLMVRGVEEGMG